MPAPPIDVAARRGTGTPERGIATRALGHLGIVVGILAGLSGLLAMTSGAALGNAENGSIGSVAQILHHQDWGDSWDPMQVAMQALHDGTGGRSVYQLVFEEYHLKFQYPPTSLLIPKAASSAGLDPHQVYFPITWLSLALTAASVFGIARWALGRYAGTTLGRWQAVGVATAAVVATLLYYPVVFGAALGQVQVWINAAFAVSLLCMLTGRERSAGILMGLVVCLKPQFALFAVWGALRRRWGFTVALLATGALGFIAGGVVFGFSVYGDYVRFLQYIGQRGESFYANQSVNGLLHRIADLKDVAAGGNVEFSESFAPYRPWVYGATVLTSLLLVVVALLRPRRPGNGEVGTDYGLAALAFTMASPIAWEHHYGVLLPIFAYLWPRLWFDPTLATRRGWRVTLFSAFVLSAGFLWFVQRLDATPANILESYLFFAAVATFVVLLLVRREGARLGGVLPGDSAIGTEAT